MTTSLTFKILYMNMLVSDIELNVFQVLSITRIKNQIFHSGNYNGIQNEKVMLFVITLEESSNPFAIRNKLPANRTTGDLKNHFLHGLKNILEPVVDLRKIKLFYIFGQSKIKKSWIGQEG